MCHIFLVQSIVEGIWVSCKSLLLWRVPQWTYVCMCLYNRMIYNPLGIYLVMGLLDQMVFLVLDPWQITTLSSIMVELIYTPTNISPASVISWFFNNGHSNWHKMVSCQGFDLHFSNGQWWWAFFNMVVGHVNVFFWKSVYSYPLPTFWWLFFFL